MTDDNRFFMVTDSAKPEDAIKRARRHMGGLQLWADEKKAREFVKATASGNNVGRWILVPVRIEVEDA